jgi:hypothetical protein
MHNLITLTNYKTRIALHDLAGSPKSASESPGALPETARRQFERPAEQLLRYLLFVNEAALPNLDAKQVIADSVFAREFGARGPRDSQGRSLRDFDLSTRTFRYRCSYLIYSEAFDALPEPAKTHVYHRLLQILSGEDDDADFESLSTQERQDILAILLETKPGLPQEWQDYARSHHLRMASATDQRGISK